MLRLLLPALLLVSLAGCNDRTREIPPVTFEPREEDMGTDVDEDNGAVVMPDAICDGQLDGTSCELAQARGVCAGQRCVLVACESGFGDCDDAPGCETAFDASDSCGGCGIACAPEQTCARGPDGYACTAGISCPTDRYDLDSDPANGCEWQAEWELPYLLAPVGLDIEAVAWNGAPLLAGGDGETRVSVQLGAAPVVSTWPEPRGEARAIDVRVDDVAERVVWTDGISMRLTGSPTTHFLAPPCQPAAVPRRFVAATTEFAATQYEVFRVDPSCGPCLERVFSLADYQGLFFNEFSVDELADCDGCATARDPECWGLRQCRAFNYTGDCGTCDGSGCPALEIVDLLQFGTELAIVTARGVVLYDVATNFGSRAEEPFDPMMAGGPRWVGALDAPGWLALFHSTGYARVLDDELAAILPDLGLAFDPDAAWLAAQDTALVAVHGDDAQLIVPTARSGRSAYLDMASAPRIQGIRPVAAVATPEGLRVLYQTAGQLFTRRVFLP